ncbi:hypothetical protein H4R18_001915 [Coemansia javaensis]|uniref:lipoyl(octanoyl) transferase n=1 Tax=Coemansia javaensis TaxID=2761396 RepID=A0A9W8HFX7_9FUNG|nr:hypothetical protein H4R18_001915 [Coemansia javaensis]
MLPARHVAAGAPCGTLGRTAAQLAGVPPVGYVYLGVVPYRAALEMQRQLCRRRIDEIQSGRARTLSDALILLQHPPVYTNGRRNRGRVPAAEAARLRALGADYVETNRGGEITFHGPGQLVGYPSMHLRDHHLGARCYVEGLENTVVGACARFGVAARAIPGFPGVWASPAEKVAALGTHVQRYVTSHGFALNCTTDMRWFREIVPCGLEGRTAVSLQSLVARQPGGPGPDPSVDAAVPAVVDSFGAAFRCAVRPLAEVSPATLDAIQELLQQQQQQAQ